MLRFFFIFVIILLAMGIGLPFIGIHNLPLWQIACGAFVPAVVTTYLTQE